MSTNPRDMPKREGAFEREPARRIFASELRECRYQFKDGEDEKSPTFVLLPTGERSNRVFLVGTLTEKTRQGEQNIFYRGRVVDPTGTFFCDGRQLPARGHAAARQDRAPRSSWRSSASPNLYQKPDGAFMNSVRVESITVVDKETRDLWVLDAAKQTLDRIDAYTDSTSPDVIKAKEQYPNIDPAVFRRIAYDALAQIKM